MRLIYRLLVLAIVLSGWVVAAMALHVVRTHGDSIPVIGRLVLLPKTDLTFSETYLDVRQWTEADRQAHPDFMARLTRLNMLDILPMEISAPGVPSAATAPATTKPSTTRPVPVPARTGPAPATGPAGRSPNVFDFGK